MHELGTALIYTAFVVTLGNGLLGIAGAMRRSPGLLAASRQGLLVSLLLFVAMDACLMQGLLTHDFRNKYISSYTDLDMPLAYLIAGFWGGEKGALLFWTTSLTAFSAWSILRNKSQSPRFLGYVTGFVSLAIFFFVMLMAFESNPFEVFRAGAGPEDGKGMNPLLQNPLMAIHPPSLLTGYIAFTVPYCYGLAALVTGQLDAQWLRDTRKWTLVSWLFLSLGLILGGAWAYTELGWGGFWMWDPVENAGLIPWFTATAFLHSVMIQERRDMLKRWNAVLVCMTFLLTIFGTFLTRSQLIDSVHAFADSTLAPYFLIYMGLIILVSVAAVGYRWKSLRAVADLDSVWSRESFFVLNNVLLVGCAFVVLWGTVFGQISEAKPVQDLYNAVVGFVAKVGIPMEPLTQKVQLGEPWFNRVMTPLGLFLLLLTGVGPLISWRRATRKNFERNFKKPLTVSSLATLAVSVIWLVHGAWTKSVWEGGEFSAAMRTVVDSLGMTEVWGVICAWFGSFVFVTILLEFHVGARARQKAHGEAYPTAVLLLTLRNKRRYGGYIVHLGLVFCFLAFAGTAFRTYQPEVPLHPGDALPVGGYVVTYTGSQEGFEADGAYAFTKAEVVVTDRESHLNDSSVAIAVQAAKPFGAFETRTEPGHARVELLFADETAARRFGARVFAPSISAKVAAKPDANDARLMHFELSSRVMEVAQIAPQVVMRTVAELKDWAKDRAPTPVEVRTTPGQPTFEATFASGAERDRFLADMRAGPLPGIRFAAYNPRAAVNKGQGRVDVIPVGVGSVLYPEVRNYKKHQSPTTEVAIQSTIAHDLYLAMRPAQGQRHISLLAVVFPFVSFLWLGAFVMLLGGAISLLPTRQAAATPASEPQEPTADPGVEPSAALP